MSGHPDFFENAAFIFAVQAVAMAAQLRAIRRAAYVDVSQFRNLELKPSRAPRRPGAGRWKASLTSSAI